MKLFNHSKIELKRLLLASMVMALILMPLYAFAQEGEPEIPGFFDNILGPEFMAAIAAIIATTKVVRNMLGNIKGTPALLITIVVSLAIGEFTFMQSQGWMYGGAVGLLAGLVSAGVFKGAKLFGKNVAKLEAGN